MAKKIWEQLQEQEQQYLEQAKQVKQETQEKFEKIASKNNEDKTLTRGKLLRAYKDYPNYNTLKKSLDDNYEKSKSNSNNISIWDRVKYVAKRFGNEALGGVTSIGEAETQTIANNLQRGKKQKISENIANNVENLLNIANPAGTMNKLFQSNLKDSIKNITDKNKTFKEKVVAQGLNSVSNAQKILPVKNTLDDSTQLLGKILPEQASEKVLKAGDKISEPYYKNNEKLNEEAQKYGTGTNLAGEVLGSVGRMVPSIAGTAITRNPNVGLTLMGTGAKGSATKEALNKGESLDEAVKIGDTQRAIEIGTEMISGGLNIFGKGALDDIVEKGISTKVKSNVGKFLAKQGYNLGGEVLEETISDVLDTFIKQGTTDKNATYSLKDFGDTAVTTMLSTLVLNTLTGGLAGDIKTIKNENKANQNAQNWISKAQEIVNQTEEQKNSLNNIQGRIDNANIDTTEKVKLKESLENYTKNNEVTNNDMQAIEATIEALENKSEATNNKVVLPEQQMNKQKINMSDVSNGLFNGEQFMTKNAQINGKNIGKIDYSIYKDEINIKMIEVNKKNRRQGIATKLLQDLQSQYPDKSIDFGYTTEDGTKLLNKITYKEENPEYVKKRNQLEQINSKIQEYENLDKKGVSLSNEDGENWNRLSDEQWKLENQLAFMEQYRTKIKNDVENNQDSLYNNANESESDIDGRINQGNDGTSRLFKESSKEQRDYSWEEYNKWEQSIKPIETNKLTNNERQSINKAKSEHNKDIFLYDENNNDNTYSGGASRNVKNKINISKQQAEYFGLDFMIEHETVESDILQNQELYQDIVKPVIEKIQNDNNFKKQVDEFWKNEKGNKPSDRLIAKDIFCDRFAEMKGNKLKYNNILSQETNMNIDYALNNFYKEIYGNEIKNSNESSFNLPERNIRKLRTSDEIANDNTISDLEAFKEQTEQLQLPTLETAENKENQLKQNGVEKSPTIDYIKKKRSKERVSLKEIKDTLAQKFINKGHYIDKLAKETKNEKLTWSYDRTMNTFNEAQISIGEKQIDTNGNVVGKSIIDIFEPAEKSGLSVEFDDYLLNKHNISRFAHEKGLYGNEVSADTSKNIVKNYEKLHPEFKKWSEDVSKYNDNNLRDLVNNGLVSEETYSNLKSMYGDYVPTFRDITDNVMQYEDDSVGNNGLKRATQSDKDILSVSESMAEQTLSIKRAIRMNNLGLELYKTLGKDSEIQHGINFDAVAMQTIGGDVIDKATDGTNTFTVFKDGEMIQFKISDDLYTAFSKDTLQNKINNSKVAKALLTPIEKASKAQRELLTTYSVGFAFNNPIKDIQDAMFNTKYSTGRFAKNYVKALYNIGTKGSWYESYKNNGGTANTYFDYNKGILPTKIHNPVKIFAEKIKSVNDVLEQAPRLAEYISTIETGGSVDQALYNSAEITTNFKRGGDVTKAINKYGANFLNASVQGLDKFYRNLTNQNGWKGYASILTKATAFQVVPAIINGILLKDDKDYEDLPEYTKDNYYLFKIGEGKFFRIPKGRVSSVIGGIARRGLETEEGKDVDWKALIDTTINQMAPNNPLTDNVIAPLVQAKKNETWYGGEIVSSRLQSLPTAEQSDESTDKFSKWLGEKINVSPKKINYVLDQYSGGIGDVVLPMLTPQAENNIIEDKFTTDAVMKNKNVSKYYSELEDLKVNSNSGKAKDEDKIKYMFMSGASKELKDLYQEKRDIQNSNENDKQKKQEVREVQKKINSIVEERLNSLKTLNKKDIYATIGNEQYYKNADKEWKQVDEEDVEKNKKSEISLKTYSNFKYKESEVKNKKVESGELEKGQSLKTKDKIQILLDSNFNNSDKSKIYENYIKSKTKEGEFDEYKVIKSSNINIDEYLKYEQQEFKSDKKDNGTLNGKTVTNSKRNKVTTYLNSMSITGEQRLLLYAMNGYSTSSAQKSQLVTYVNSLNIDGNTKLQLYNRFSGFTSYKNGTVKYK